MNKRLVKVIVVSLVILSAIAFLIYSAIATFKPFKENEASLREQLYECINLSNHTIDLDSINANTNIRISLGKENDTITINGHMSHFLPQDILYSVVLSNNFDIIEEVPGGIGVQIACYFTVCVLFSCVLGGFILYWIYKLIVYVLYYIVYGVCRFPHAISEEWHAIVEYINGGKVHKAKHERKKE